MNKTLLLSLLMMLGGYCYSQVYTGGNMGFNFDNDNIYIDVSPILGYCFGKPKVGVSPFYSYTQNMESKKSEYTYGGRVFSQYQLIKSIFLHAEFGMVNIPDYSTPDNSLDRTWVMSLPVGAGYEYAISKRIKAQAMILYDLLLDESNTTIHNPIIRGGVTYDF